MSSITINVVSEFSRFPSARFEEDGPCSGERFREEHLLPALQQYEDVTVDFHGVFGMAASFLDEAFGGLVLKHGYGASELNSRLHILSDDPTDVRCIQRYITEADVDMQEPHRNSR